jgi:hypothetical protein
MDSRSLGDMQRHLLALAVAVLALGVSVPVAGAQTDDAQPGPCPREGIAVSGVPGAFLYQPVILDARMLAPDAPGRPPGQPDAVSPATRFLPEEPIRFYWTIMPRTVGDEYFARVIAPNGLVFEWMRSTTNQGEVQPPRASYWTSLMRPDLLGWDELPSGQYRHEIFYAGNLAACVEWSFGASAEDPGVPDTPVSNWLPPEQVSELGRTSAVPRILVEPDGTVHLVWHSFATEVLPGGGSRGVDRQNHYRQRRPDGTWGETATFEGCNGNSPILARHPDGDVWAFIGGIRDCAFRLEQGAPVRDRRLTPGPIGFTIAQEAVFDGTGTLHAFWFAEGRLANEGALHHASRTPAGAWSEPTRLSESTTARLATAQVTADGTVHVAWVDGDSLVDRDLLARRGKAVHRARSPGGEWSAPTDVGADVELEMPDRIEHIALVLREGNVCALVTTLLGGRQRCSAPGVAWGEWAPIPQSLVPAQSMVATAVAPAGVQYVVTSASGKAIRIAAMDTAEDWLPAVDLEAPGVSFLWPVLALGADGNAHVAYAASGTASGPAEVYYRHGVP